VRPFSRGLEVSQKNEFFAQIPHVMPLPAEIHSPAVRAFLREHRDADPAQLALHARRYPDLPVRALAAQVQARQKARTKLPTWAEQDAVWFPPLLSVEQSSSEATARFKASLVSGRYLLDLTGGMGVDAWAFAARVERVRVVERNADLADLTQYNLGVLGVPNATVVAGDSRDELGTTPDEKSAPDWLYLDPARRDGANQKVVRLEDGEPDVLALQDRLLARAPRVLLKAAPLLDIDRAVSQLRGVRDVYVVAVGNEVKELLFVLTRAAPPEPALHAVRLRRDGTPDVFTFSRTDERAAEVPFAAPRRYLYEPGAALLKAGAFRVLAQRYGLAKLHPSSHLYTSEARVEGFPGRTFEVVGLSKPDRADLRRYLPDGRANLTVRNFPLTVAQLRQKLQLAEGGEDYVFATTDPQNRKILVICRRGVQGLVFSV
jgi:hypothetical protein